MSKNSPSEQEPAAKFKISRAEHSAILRRYQREKEKVPGAHTSDWNQREVKTEAAVQDGPEVSPDSQALPDELYLVRQKSRSQVIVEQELQHGRKNEALVAAKIRLTTAVRGRRKIDGCSQAGYLLRLEVLALSPGARVEGFTLGLWCQKQLSLEAGSIICPDLIWAGFQPLGSLLQGRFLIADQAKHRLLDLPWKTEGLIPGYEPFA